MSGHRIPAWRVTLDGRDLTDTLAPRLIELSLSEHRGGEADELTLRLQDHDGRLALPERGAELTVALGWQDSGLQNKGRFRVDEIEHSGAPDRLTLRARSADLTAALRNRRERSWDQTTLGQILKTLAGEHQLTPRIAADLAQIAIPHLDQTESDANLLTRLGRRHDAVATIKAGRLLFFPVGQGTNASGQPLPTATIRRSDGDRHRYHIADRDSYTGVRADWHDSENAERKTVLVGDGDDAKQLKESFASEQEAKQAARAEWQRIQRSLATMSYQLALGRADLYPEQPVRLEGFKAEIDQTDWLIASCRHIVGGQGFTTAIELETRTTI
ncbi:phage late control D family protein [Microbulbifer sp. TYP-18]|uniref:phage late control D family protein n=1 Tax=Microbulbifer sp. TYP-18 TaxID=3230024 RepID=UPI0034C691CA